MYRLFSFSRRLPSCAPQVGLALAVLLGGALLAAAPARAADTDELHLDAVERVEITGDAGSLTLNTSTAGPTQAHVSARRSGWFSRWYSSWFFNDCRSKSRLWVEGTVLHVSVSTPPLLEASDCTVDVTATLRPGVNVTIALQAVEAQLDGRFGAIDIDTRAGNVNLRGGMEQASLRATALRAQLDLSQSAPPRAVNFAVGSLDARLDFRPGARVGYRVEAKAALVDSERPNDPAGDTQLVVEGDYVRLVLR
ncbi:hypothetical protein [Ancylobacter pratisalsi]|uniref:DUF4402 domain-containing protein n=1 Tax=Ancylobacter pratisalsi TaxID=1745854 RepID=A0A6P1YJM3_9HYPH|nr:hypothetical protein [Ancylobacter pratisalsi]QIB33352.1 hypothetical protein G3A50_06220 [Ancylobacter pratisalsi]